MKNSKFSEHQIIKALKENEQGRLVGDLSRGNTQRLMSLSLAFSQMQGKKRKV